jgi:hypothetical protein
MLRVDNVETTIKIYLPSEPRLYSVDDTKLVLYGFVPNETVRLFAYREELLLKFSGWSQYQVDSSGKLVLKAPNHVIYYVVGNLSGLVGNRRFGHGGFEGRPILVAPCGGLPSYLESNHTMQPNASVESMVELRAEPGFLNATESQVAQGTLVHLRQGPKCIDNTPWWQILIGNGQMGWIPEYQDGVYLLKPYPKDSLALIAKDIPEFEFNLLIANHLPPEDVFEEVDFFGERARICDQPPYAVPTIFREPLDGELFMQSTLISCGWQELEFLKGTIQYPDGRTHIQYIQASGIDTYSAQLDFTPELEDPPGTYTFTLEGQGGIVTASVEIRPLNGPRLYVMDFFHIFLYHFAPGESVRLFCYHASGPQPGKLNAWQDLTVDQSGNQPVEVDATNCTFVALGQTSGEVHEVQEWIGTVKKSCGGLSSRLNVNTQARVTFTDGIATPVRAAEGYAQGIITSLPEGTIINLVKGPRCADNNLWWPVETSDHVFGWLPEEQNGLYLLEPIQ